MSPKKPDDRSREARGSGSVPIISIASASGEACARVDRVAEYLDGTLDAAAQDELLDHLPTCEACQAALHGEVQLRDREEELREAEQAKTAGRAHPTAIPTPMAMPTPIAIPNPIPTAMPNPTAIPIPNPIPTANPTPTPTPIPIPIPNPNPIPTALPTPIAAARAAAADRRARLRWQLPTGLALVAAAAVAALYLRSGGGTTGAAPIQLALAPVRPIEGRLTWRPAAGHRPYETMRASEALAGERIDPEALARLSRNGDCAGLAAAYLLSGELVRAQRQYAEPGCLGNLELTADRAALEVALGNPARALELADEVLAVHPAHPVAMWNRALALRDLKLGLAAAAAFDHIASSRGEGPSQGADGGSAGSAGSNFSDSDAGWRLEAAQRAELARAPLEAARHSWDRIIALDAQMIPDGEVLPLELARAVPFRARLRFHDAVRTATTSARLEALRPLARELEGRAGTGLEAVVDAAAKVLRPSRAALVPFYVELFGAQRVADAAAWQRWKAAAKAAGASDLLLGALYYAEGTSAETVRLAAATGDPWLIGLTELDLVTARIAADDVSGAGAHLAKLEALCTPQSPAYLCLRAALKRAELSLQSNPAATATAAAEALELATASGEFMLRGNAAYYLAAAERMRGVTALARGYYEEYQLSQSAKECVLQRRAATFIALMAFELHRFDELGRQLAAMPRCEEPAEVSLLVLQADMLDAQLPVDRARWTAALAARAAAPDLDPSDALTLSYLRLRDQLRDDAPARDRMTALIAEATASDSAMAERVAVAAETTLIVDAGRRGQWREALRIAAAAHGLPASPERCALALASDGFQLAAVIVGAAGDVSGLYLRDVGAGRQWSPPPSVHQALARCPQVTALAFPPWLSGEPPLAPQLAWSFAMNAPADRAPAAPGPSAPRPATSERVVVVASPTPPPALRLAPLSAPPAADAGAAVTTVTTLSGPAATIDRVAAEAARATLLELHAHTTRVASSDAPALALSDSPAGWALTAEAVSRWQLTERPVVLLADCAGARPAAYTHVAWGLPAAFRKAGARAVVASLVDIPDAEGGAFFAQIRKELRTDDNVAAVVARLRAEKIAVDPTSWVRHVVVFQ